MKGKLCFIKRKSRNLVSNCRSFCVENISIFENRERTNEKLWTFLRNAPSFLVFLPFFGETTHASSHPCHSPFLPPQLRTRGRARPCASRTQRVRNSCLHPSPSPQSVDTVCFAGEGLCPFLPSPVKERGVKPSHTSRCFIGSYRRMVKR